MSALAMRQLLKRLPIALACLLALVTASASLRSSADQPNCWEIYGDASNGWVIEMCETDPEVETPMEVVLDGVPQGNAALIRVYHQSESGPGTPQIAVLYASGYVRLKQNANPSPSIPFGSSFVLGPAYWPDLSTYHHNPQLSRLDIDTSWLPNGPLRMQSEATNHDLDIAYEMALPPARDRQTRLHVTQIYTATANIEVDPTRRAESQGFKLIQGSSMFINEGGVCDGGHTDCHDSNAIRYIGADLVRQQIAFDSLTLPGFILDAPQPLGSTWLDLLHTDDESWQGNTPNVRIALDALPTDHTVTPQGWIGATTDPNQDNVGVWLHDDGPASQNWTVGQSDRVSYWLLAQDDPPEPWADLGLRSGLTFLDFEGTYDCFLVKDAHQPTSGMLTAVAGYSDTALQMAYDLGGGDGNWAQIRCNFAPPLDLSAYDHLRLDWRGDPVATNSLQVGLINPGAGQEHIFARGYHHVTHHHWWGQLITPFRFLAPWTSGTGFDPSQVSAFFVSVVKDPVDDVGGAGSIAIDNLNAYNVVSRTTPVAFETASANTSASTASANWLATQQQSTGLLKSWEEESRCIAHTYDQALALIVFSREGMWDEADDLVEALVRAQHGDGSWYKSYDCSDSGLPCVHCEKWAGDIAWAVYALGRYLELGGTHPGASTAMCRGARWLAGQVTPSDGCLAIDHTEATIDAWWALQAAGHIDEAEGLRNCLLTHYWDEQMGRFKGGKGWWQPYLDNQTWGGAFLKAVGEEERALRALSYAGEVLLLPAQGGQLLGLDGQAGPWSVWNEGTGQYVAVRAMAWAPCGGVRAMAWAIPRHRGGEGADDLLPELLAQQRGDGAMSGSPDEFLGGGVWTTRWHGVAPTAWLYNALQGEPFHPGAIVRCSCVHLPIALKHYAP